MIINTPPSDRCKPIVKALLAYPDAGTEANHLEVLRGVAQVRRSAVGDRQKVGDLLHPFSYTHLDVYKRQGRSRGKRGLLITGRFYS